MRVFMPKLVLRSVFLSVLSACGSGGSADEPTTEPLALSKQQQDIKTLVGLDAKVLQMLPQTRAIGSALEGALKILDLIDVANPDPILQLRSQLDGLSWQVSQEFLAQDLALASSAVNQARIAMQTGMLLTADGAPMNNSDTAVTHAERPEASQRAYNPVSELIRRTVGEPDHPNNVVYDWRLGVPTLLQLIAMRLMVVSAFDPHWTEGELFIDELTRHRDALLYHYQKMKDGIRCGTVPADLCSGFATGCIDTLACIDMYTGTINYNADTYSRSMRWNEAWDLARREMYRDMPLFELRSAIDALELLARPGTKDLAPHDSPIYSTLTLLRDNLYRGPGLCLDAQGGGTDNGTPVWIYDCDPFGLADESGRLIPSWEPHFSGAQLWTYDRASGMIINQGSGKCLDVKDGGLQPGASIQIWECIEGNDNQRWSWDVSMFLLWNALGTVLDVQSGTIASETPVQTSNFDDSAAQGWLTLP